MIFSSIQQLKNQSHKPLKGNVTKQTFFIKIFFSQVEQISAAS